MEAVDSEYNQSLQNDVWRFYSLVQHEVAVKGSAMNRFNCGNAESLKQPGIRESLLDFHKTWYSSNIMKLCVISNHPLEKLESWVTTMFSAVPNKSITLPPLDKPLPLYDITADGNSTGKIIRYIPVKDKDVLTLMWPSLPYT